MKVVKRYFTDYVQARRCLAKKAGRCLKSIGENKWVVYWELY